MQVVQGRNRLFTNADDHVADTDACGPRGSVRLDPDDLHRILVGQIMEPYETSVQMTYASYQPEVSAPDATLSDQLRNYGISCIGGDGKANPLGHCYNSRIDPHHVATGVNKGPAGVPRM